MKLEDIGTNIVREDEFNPRWGYDMVRLENLQKSCTIGVKEYRRVRRTMFSE